MLLSIEKNKINDIPKSHKKEWDTWRSRISDDEFEAICDEIEKKIDADLENGVDIQVAGWIPGNDWIGTVYEPIWSKSCKKHHTHSGWFFGNIVWWIMINRREEEWYFHKQENISSMIYFQIKEQNA